MSSNPLMMGYEGRDLLLTGAAWPTVGSLPKPVCAGCGRWPAAPVSDESAFEVAWPPAFGVHKNALYKSLALPDLTESFAMTQQRFKTHAISSRTHSRPGWSRVLNPRKDAENNFLRLEQFVEDRKHMREARALHLYHHTYAVFPPQFRKQLLFRAPINLTVCFADSQLGTLRCDVINNVRSRVKSLLLNRAKWRHSRLFTVVFLSYISLII